MNHQGWNNTNENYGVAHETTVIFTALFLLSFPMDFRWCQCFYCLMNWNIDFVSICRFSIYCWVDLCACMSMRAKVKVENCGCHPSIHMCACCIQWPIILIGIILLVVRETRQRTILDRFCFGRVHISKCQKKTRIDNRTRMPSTSAKHTIIEPNGLDSTHFDK